jgi:ribonuclease P protein component
MNYTLTKQERLKRGDFRGTQWTKCSETKHFSLLIHKNRYEFKRIAVTIRKQVGDAAVRNRVRRLIKESYRLQKDLFVEGHDNLIKVKRVPPKLFLKGIEDELGNLLRTRKIHTSIRQ